MMNSKEFKRIYRPKLGRYVYAHRGNGLIVDNVLKPMEFGSKVVKPFLKAKAKETISKAGDRLGKKAIQTLTQKSENAGELIGQRLDGKQKKGKSKRQSQRRQTEDANAFLTNLIAMS